MRLRYRAAETAPKGNYWRLETGERIVLTTAGVLTGEEGAIYVKAHPAVILLAAPFLGLAYAAFLPFIGIALMAQVVGSKAVGLAAAHLVPVAGFRWTPGAAYLSGRKKGLKEGGAGRKG
ncbi:MAG: hypothetical protein R3231_10390 [bacterium]|nr:hypothetical protein [bacterium]